MRKFLYLILAIAAVAAWRDWGQRAIDRPPGVLVPEYPRQESAAPPQTLDIEGYLLTPRAKFEVRARVLSRENYPGVEEKVPAETKSLTGDTGISGGPPRR